MPSGDVRKMNPHLFRNGAKTSKKKGPNKTEAEYARRFIPADCTAIFEGISFRLVFTIQLLSIHRRRMGSIQILAASPYP